MKIEIAVVTASFIPTLFAIALFGEWGLVFWPFFAMIAIAIFDYFS